MTFDDSSCPKVRTHLAERLIDGEALIVNAERGEIIVLNGCGAFVWKLLDGMHDVGSIIDLVEDEFDVDTETARGDVLEFLQSLSERHVLED